MNPNESGAHSLDALWQIIMRFMLFINVHKQRRLFLVAIASSTLHHYIDRVHGPRLRPSISINAPAAVSGTSAAQQLLFLFLILILEGEKFNYRLYINICKHM